MSAAKASTKKSAASKKVGRGTRWTEEQVRLLLDQVKGSATAKEAFEKVAKQLGKSTGTVQQKYYNLQKQAGGAGRGARKQGRPARAASSAVKAAPRTSGGGGGALPSATYLRDVSVDELVGLATRVKAEVDRRRRELEAASKLLAG